ncbi:unnamed protein product [Oikopleura dioica]|uniref:MOFRL-associated domain-containing protein n=1 Tax=Oikopleura dioica TaxID=34765 RepID=E4YZD8_OIKDI|nr:unnamed protein product [Oikopleura dioica]
MLLEDIFLEALPSIDPKRLVLENLRTKSFSNEKVHIIGFGKAAAGMAAGIIEFFGENLIEGIISVPVGTRKSMEQNNRTDLWPVHKCVKVFEVAKDNLPDQAAVDASNLILDFVKTLKSDDKLIVCCSGGGSACLACPADWISLQDKLKVIKKLQSKGATIQELNSIRSLLSKTKGGKLLTATKATVTTLILSDIIGDPVELIASGPTVQPIEKDEQFYDDLLK